jgi:hypothetical protein
VYLTHWHLELRLLKAFMVSWILLGLGYTCLHCIFCWWFVLHGLSWTELEFEIPSQFCLGELGIITF